MDPNFRNGSDFTRRCSPTEAHHPAEDVQKRDANGLPAESVESGTADVAEEDAPTQRPPPPSVGHARSVSWSIERRRRGGNGEDTAGTATATGDEAAAMNEREDTERAGNLLFDRSGAARSAAAKAAAPQAQACCSLGTQVSSLDDDGDTADANTSDDTREEARLPVPPRAAQTPPPRQQKHRRRLLSAEIGGGAGGTGGILRSSLLGSSAGSGAGRKKKMGRGESSGSSLGDGGGGYLPQNVGLRLPPPPPPGLPFSPSSRRPPPSTPTDDDWRRALMLPHPSRQSVTSYGSVRDFKRGSSGGSLGLGDLGGGDTRHRDGLEVSFDGGESIVFAPDDAPCPPQTPLWGSSKFVANVKHLEYLRELELPQSVRSVEAPESLVSLWGGISASGGIGIGGIDDDDDESSAALSDRVAWRTRTNFYEDAITFAEGSIPQSILVALAYGVACGFIAFLYYEVFFFLLEFVWHTLPNRFVVDVWPEWAYVLWIPSVTFFMSLLTGLSIRYLGEPGDLAYTVKCVHEKAYESTSHIIPMFFSSLFSLLGGASCGPEAPLVSICAATSGYMSRKIFKQRNRNVVRKHTLMGMAGALSAFFGVPLGGSLFALEVNSRFGVEYFEHAIESIFCGVVCLTVFRALCRLKIGPIWDLGERLEDSDAVMVVVGGFIGLLGAGLAALFSAFHWRLMDLFHALGLVDDENRRAVPRALVGAVFISILGLLVPHTMFWGEFEFESIVNMVPSRELPHVWPPAGLIGFEMDSWGHALVVGFAKLLAISFTTAGGYRGGYIFPFFTAGAAFGRAFVYHFPFVPVQISCLCFAASINVAITRTALATPLILAFLAGEHNAMPAILAASVVSLFATGYMPFIKSQIIRSDLDHSLFYKRGKEPLITDTVRSLAETLRDVTLADIEDIVV